MTLGQRCEPCANGRVSHSRSMTPSPSTRARARDALALAQGRPLDLRDETPSRSGPAAWIIPRAGRDGGNLTQISESLQIRQVSHAQGVFAAPSFNAVD